MIWKIRSNVRNTVNSQASKEIYTRGLMTWLTSGICCQASKSEFSSWTPHGRREPTSTGCLLTSTHALWHAYQTSSPHTLNTQTFFRGNVHRSAEYNCYVTIKESFRHRRSWLYSPPWSGWRDGSYRSSHFVFCKFLNHVNMWPIQNKTKKF